MLWLQHQQSISLTKWPFGLKKNYKASSITTFILSTAWMASTGDDRGRGTPSFLPLAWTGRWDSILLLHIWNWKASLSRLVDATQQLGGKRWHDGYLSRMARLKFDLEKVVVLSYSKSFYDRCQKLFSSKCDIDHTTESTMVPRPKRPDWPKPNIPTKPI
jgi:hypothetical protein